MKLWKVQKFFEDVVYDLRSRGLLPVAILLLVAMVAVPVLISRGSSDSPSASPQPTADLAQNAPEAQAAVVTYNPGIRDYRKRLDSLSPKDPFRQQFTQPAADASKLTTTDNAVAATGSGSGSDTASTGSTGSDTTVSGGGGTGGGKKKKKSSKTAYTYSVNVLAGDVSTALTPFNNVASLTPLPSPASPVVVYYGLSQDNKWALFLVSNKVDTLTGPGTCVPAPDDCSLLALMPGQAEDLHYTQDGKTYRVVVAAIKRTAK